MESRLLLMQPEDSMRKDTATTTSVWTDATSPEIESLQGDQQADVCVIGAGIAGLTVAYMLSGMGKSVVVIDDGNVGGGETGRTTAHLTHALGSRFDAFGKVVNGPATTDLAPTDVRKIA